MKIFDTRAKGNISRKKGVAPVLATLLMIAVAVAMSVIIFMWSQGFLSNTSNAVGGQQGSQNQAAQSSISIEEVTGTVGSTLTAYIRNVGAVGSTLGTCSATPGSGNSGFSIPATLSVATASLIKGGATTATIAINTGGQNARAGDTITVKCTTTVGTFAQASFTVP